LFNNFNLGTSKSETVLETGAVFGRGASVKERRVDQLDRDPTVLHHGSAALAISASLRADYPA
jgi:hypothetical protein